MQIITSVDEVIDALGGNKHLVRLLGYDSRSAASNWRKQGFLPASTFLICTRELSKRGLIAAPSLWGMKEEPKRKLRRVNGR